MAILTIINDSIADSTEEHFPLPTASTAKHRPFEGELMISTLWPEIEKVFGHGYEVDSGTVHKHSLLIEE